MASLRLLHCNTFRRAQALENRGSLLSPLADGGIERWLIAAPGILIFIIGQTRIVFLGGNIANLVDRVATVSTMSGKSGAKCLQTDEKSKWEFGPRYLHNNTCQPEMRV